MALIGSKCILRADERIWPYLKFVFPCTMKKLGKKMGAVYNALGPKTATGRKDVIVGK
jgi:hypothetical protein